MKFNYNAALTAKSRLVQTPDYRHSLFLRDWTDAQPGYYQDEPEPIRHPMKVSEPPIDLVQLKAQVNFLQNKITELRAEKKKRDDGIY